jgi:hypothetical protein
MDSSLVCCLVNSYAYISSDFHISEYVFLLIIDLPGKRLEEVLAHLARRRGS